MSSLPAGPTTRPFASSIAPVPAPGRPRVRPTMLGWKGLAFYAVIFVAFFASAYSNLFFLLLAFLTLLGVMGLWWTRRNMRGMAGEVLDVEPAPADAGQPVKVRFEAPRGERRFQVECELVTAGHGTVSVQADMVNGEAVIEGRLPPLPRGLYRVEQAFVSSTYPLGLLRARAAIPAPEDLIVYPVPAELPHARTGNEVLAELCGQHVSTEGNLQPSGLREYLPGDEVRRVHWKASARRGDLIIKEWEGGAGQGIEVLLDRRTTPELLERSLSLLAALALMARDNKEPMTLHSQGMTGTFGPEHRPWRGLLRFLAQADLVPAGGAGPPPVSPSVTRFPLQTAEALERAGHGR